MRACERSLRWRLCQAGSAVAGEMPLGVSEERSATNGEAARSKEIGRRSLMGDRLMMVKLQMVSTH